MPEQPTQLQMNAETKFCPMFQPMPLQGKLQGTINLQFVPCLKEKCQLWSGKDCRLTAVPMLPKIQS
jgi:hypothetical protein